MVAEPAHWDRYLSKRRREHWGAARAPSSRDYPDHLVIKASEARRKALREASERAGGGVEGRTDGVRRPGPSVVLSVTCSCCGRGFAGRRSTARFCSGACRLRARRGRCELEAS
jgi:hypothetical protein